MKIQIYNQNYTYAASGDRLILSPYPDDKPWHVGGFGKIRHFRTHAKAVAWATRKVREGRKK